MEAGGLRADVNVSVRRADDVTFSLGTRTEMKNLNSFKAVEDAIVAERNRQIYEIGRGNGSAITSETRGWAPSQLGGETYRLRGKEGEVDYRYMPEPDLGPVIIDENLVQFLGLTTGALPDVELESLVSEYGMTPKDAMALMVLDEGGRTQFFYDTVDAFEYRLHGAQQQAKGTTVAAEHRSFIANWVLHQLGRLTSDRNSGIDAANDLEMTPDGTCRIPIDCFADILIYRFQGKITANVAKELLFAVFRGDIGEEVNTRLYGTVKEAVDTDNLWFDEISADEYQELALQAMQGEDKTLKMFVDPKRYPQGKLQFLIGKLLRLGPEGRTDPLHAEAAMKAAIEDYVARVKAQVAI